jgi:hypothetical protein
MAFVICWFIPIKRNGTRAECFKAAVLSSLGFWFVGACTARLLGVAIVRKAPSPRNKPVPGTEDAVIGATPYETVG